MSADKRSVATDALDTLGTIIDDKQKRDAIHLAVEPVICGEDRLYPGTHITVRFGTAYRTEPGQGLGIVDPFLADCVKRGERFWFVMYPRQVRSLRHVWAHPSFPDEAVAAAPAGPTTAKEVSEKWLRDFCATADCPGYHAVMGAIQGGNRNTWDEDYLHFDGSDAHGDIPDEFWDHVEVVLGRAFPRAKYFSCSC